MPAKKGQKEVDGPPGGVVTWLIQHEDGGLALPLTGTTAFEAAAKSAWPFASVRCTPQPTTEPPVLVPVERRWDNLRAPEPPRLSQHGGPEYDALGSVDDGLDEDELCPQDRAVLGLP